MWDKDIKCYNHICGEIHKMDILSHISNLKSPMCFHLEGILHCQAKVDPHMCGDAGVVPQAQPLGEEHIE